MTKRKSPTTLVGIRELLLRIAILVALVGLGGVLVKTGVFAQTTSSLILKPEATDQPGGVDEPLSHSDLTTNLTDHAVPVRLPLVLATTISQRVQDAMIPPRSLLSSYWL